MSEISFKGVGVALITPFNIDCSIDFEALENSLERLCNSSIDYIVALGTTAETPTLNPAERKAIADFIAEKVNLRKQLVIGIGGNSTERTIRDFEYYNLEAYSGILSVVPYYNKPTAEGIYRHFKELSLNSPLPLILYNIPARTGVNMDAETTVRLAEECNNIVAIKEASGNLNQIEKIILHSPENFNVISGDDNLNIEILKRGGIGTISVLANIFPDFVASVVNLCRGGCYEIAENMDRPLKDFYNYLFCDGNPAGIKCALSELKLIKNILRLPLVPVSRVTEENIKNFISRNNKLQIPQLVSI